MCGILGLYSTDMTSYQRGVDSFDEARDLLQHRGPDSAGTWHDKDNFLSLGHRRLSIVDLSPAGSQPMLSSSGNLVMVFNGEIYNFRGIRRDLESEGYQFKGSADSEVLLAAIDVWGLEAALELIDGMFAAAVWDRRKKSLSLFRDRFGEKPLYYGWNGQSFGFSSELKPLKKLFNKKLSLCPEAIASYFRHGTVPGPLSIYEGIYKLVPGSYLSLNTAKAPEQFSPSITSQRPGPKPYWRVVDSYSPDVMYEDPVLATKDLDALLNGIIENQSVTDVPIGTFLSGGIDSTLVTAIWQAQNDKPVDTFTIGFKEKYFNEAIFAGEISKHLGTRHHEHYIDSSEILSTVVKMPQYFDEPFADPSQIPMYILSKFAKQHVSVSFSGDGGDEFFGGYNRYIYGEKVARLYRVIPLLVRGLAGKVLGSIPVSTIDSLYDLLKRFTLSSSGHQAMVGTKIHKLGQSLGFGSFEQLYDYLIAFWPDTSGLLVSGGGDLVGYGRNAGVAKNNLDYAMLHDQHTYLTDDNLVKGDRASMAVSLEMRQPLLDHKVAEFSWSLPRSMKIHDGQSKWLLRRLLYQYVPSGLIDRPKMGFSPPVGQWMKTDLREWSENLLNPARLNAQGLFNSSYVAAIWQEHIRGRKDHSLKLWSLIIFQAWLDEQEGDC